MASPGEITVEVVYALPVEQVVVTLELTAGATVADAIHASGLIVRYPEAAEHIARENHVGIHGKTVALSALLKCNDRVEIYRALTVDPKEARRRRARLRAAKQKLSNAR